MKPKCLHFSKRKSKSKDKQIGGTLGSSSRHTSVSRHTGWETLTQISVVHKSQEWIISIHTMKLLLFKKLSYYIFIKMSSNQNIGHQNCYCAMSVTKSSSFQLIFSDTISDLDNFPRVKMNKNPHQDFLDWCQIQSNHDILSTFQLKPYLLIIIRVRYNRAWSCSKEACVIRKYVVKNIFTFF